MRGLSARQQALSKFERQYRRPYEVDQRVEVKPSYLSPQRPPDYLDNLLQSVCHWIRLLSLTIVSVSTDKKTLAPLCAGSSAGDRTTVSLNSITLLSTRQLGGHKCRGQKLCNLCLSLNVEPILDGPGHFGKGEVRESLNRRVVGFILGLVAVFGTKRIEESLLE